MLDAVQADNRSAGSVRAVIGQAANARARQIVGDGASASQDSGCAAVSRQKRSRQPGTAGAAPGGTSAQNDVASLIY